LRAIDNLLQANLYPAPLVLTISTTRAEH